MTKTKNNKYQSISTSINIHKYLLVSAISLVIFFGIVQGAEAATCYVSPSGNATWSNCTNINTPCSAATAMANAVAGDVVNFRGGTYTLAGPHRSYHGVLEPANGGIAGSPITFQAYPGENPVMDCQVSDAYDNCFSLGTNAKNYITFDGFTLKTNSGSKMAGMMVGSGDTPRTGNVIIRNMIIDGGSTVITSTDNRDGIRIEQASGVLIQNCKLFNFRQVSNWANTAAIKAYFDDHITIENNEIYNSSAGIYFKCDISYSTIRYNFIHDCNEAIHGQVYSVGVDRNLQHNKVYHNVVVNNTFSAIAVAQEDTANADDWEVYNNTIYNSVRGVVPANGNWKIYNNIVYNNTNSMTNYKLSTFVEEDYNQWGTPFKIWWHIYGVDEAIYTNLATWQATTHLENGGHPGTGDLASDPLFQNGSGTFSQLNDFKLASNSPCKGTGKGGADMGANIDLVGVNAGQAQPLCGDGSCNGGETCSNCSSDCGTCIDTTSPTISNGSPTGTLPVGATQTTMSVSTNENATCRWSSAAGVVYSSMLNTFSTTGGASHSTTIAGLSNGQTYNRYVRCQDTAGNPNASDYIITFSIASSGGATVTLNPTQDTYIDINTDVNISNTVLNTYTWPNNQIANAVLMKFNLSSIPSNANIQDAKLYLYLTEADTNASYPTYTNTLHRIINHNPNLSLATGYTYDGVNSWTASSCCYNNAPLAQADISSAYDTQQINKTLGFKSWNAAQLIKDWLSNPSANYGLLINSDSTKPADTYRTYASSEYATASWRPYLDITYTLTADTTPPAAPTGLTVN